MAGSPKGKRVNPYSHSNDSQLLKRRLAVLQMRTEGMSFRAIAAVLGVSYNTVRNDEKWALDEYQMPAVDEYRRKVIADAEAQLARLHQMLKKPQYVVSSKGTYVLGPDDKPIEDPKYRNDIENSIMKLRDQLIRMLGANAPAQTEITVEHVDSTDLEIRRLIEEQNRRNAESLDQVKANQDPSA
ncbi:helix-turn-helix domain-containing protein [Streptomyces sp. NPDC005385]|uniref:helix-turn-helix domain-containing protein n=1 Tax=Streptomyces sp. NPDC005385 TaxID=3157039 RepID=UPI0033A82102